jgi:hypothetical protein
MSSFDCPSSCVAQRYLPLDRLQEAREPRGLGLIERHGERASRTDCLAHPF